VTSFRLPEPPKFCPHAPHPRQAVFLGLDDPEALYGGAAGGGKSDALLMAALQYVHIPGYSALILRKSYADLALPDAIMDRAKTWLMSVPGVNWNDARKVFTFPSGATLTFGYLKYARDRYRYQGSAYQFIGFDEATQFAEDEYLYLFSRLRRPSIDGGHPLAKVPLRIRCASNPGGIGHEWVKNRFVPQVDQFTGNLVIPANDHGDRRVFIPAKLDDNPSLDAVEYKKNLQELDPVLRAQLLDGDWGARPPGEMFDRNWFRVVTNPVERAALLMRTNRWGRFWDFAGTEASKESKSKDPDWTVGVLMGRTIDQEIVIGDVRRFRARPNDVERIVLETAVEDAQRYGCRMVRNEQEPGSAGKFVAETMAKKLAGYDYLAIRTTGPKTERARPFSTYAANGLVLCLSGLWLKDYLEEIEAFPMQGVHDDQVDASSLGFSQLISTYFSGSGQIDPVKTSYHAPRRVTTSYMGRRSILGGRR
jgi:predicted phage terminase large subunit-like protein